MATGGDAASVDDLLKRPAPSKPGKTLADVKDDMFNRIREVFNIGRFARLAGGTGGYSHHIWGVIEDNSEVRDNTTFGVLALTLHATSYDWRFTPIAGTTFTESGTTYCH